MQFSWRAMRRSACFAAVLVILGAATGCGAGKGKVTGTVTGPDGKPLPLGRITFLPASGPPGFSGDIQDGKYSVDDVTTGENNVSIDTAYIRDENEPIVKRAGSGKTAMNGTGSGGPPPKGAPPEYVKMQKEQEEAPKIAKEKLAKYRPIPEKFADTKTSGLSVTVKSGDNTFPVDLSGKK
jgi:hypothetical protein